MNKLKFLNKLRKRQLDGIRKSIRKKIVKQIEKNYVQGTILEFCVSDKVDHQMLFDNDISLNNYKFVIEYLNNLNIKYEIIKIKIYEANEYPVRVKIKFIYEEE